MTVNNLQNTTKFRGNGPLHHPPLFGEPTRGLSDKEENQRIPNFAN